MGARVPIRRQIACGAGWRRLEGLSLRLGEGTERISDAAPAMLLEVAHDVEDGLDLAAAVVHVHDAAGRAHLLGMVQALAVIHEFLIFSRVGLHAKS